MAFPSPNTGDIGTTQQTTNASTWSCNYATNIVAGDLLILLMSIDGSVTPSATDWTFSQTANGTANTLAVGRKIAVGGESGTLSVTIGASEQGMAQMLRISGWFGDLATGFTLNTATTGSSATPTTGTITPAWGADDNLFIVSAGWDGTPTTTTPWGGSFTNIGGATSGGAGGAGIYSSYRSVNASSQAAVSMTNSATETWVAYGMAIRPLVPRTPRGSLIYPQILAH